MCHSVLLLVCLLCPRLWDDPCAYQDDNPTHECPPNLTGAILADAAGIMEENIEQMARWVPGEMPLALNERRLLDGEWEGSDLEDLFGGVLEIASLIPGSPGTIMGGAAFAANFGGSSNLTDDQLGWLAWAEASVRWIEKTMEVSADIAPRLDLAAAMTQTCFTAETPMRTKAGSIVAEEVRPGMRLLASPESDHVGPVDEREVLEVYTRVAPIWHLHINGQVIRTTREHRFYVFAKDWRFAWELEPGDYLRSDDGRWFQVEEMFDSGVVETVYNFEIAEYHTYFVGDPSWGFSIWAHNGIPKGLGGYGAGSRVSKLKVPKVKAPRVKAPKGVKLKGPRHKHHSDPVFMGGKKNQKLTNMPAKQHRKLHKDLNDFLVKKKDRHGNHMRPQRGNKAEDIQAHFSPRQRRQAMAEFYKGPGSNYKNAASDFFAQHPHLR